MAGFPESIKRHKEQKRNETDTANGGGTQEQEEPDRSVIEDLTDQQNSARTDEKTASEQRRAATIARNSCTRPAGGNFDKSIMILK